LHGQVKYIELPKYYNASNIGIVYIPQKDYYEYQPSTKLYEYLLAGMPVIATNTFENRKEISNIKYGVICQDNPNSFSNALKVIQENLFNFQSGQIIGDKKVNSWENIVNKNLEPYIRKIINK
jgi:glycosyltransferase involved in cell wall biosynthesis